jgi:uncharacterized protein YjeT (DUF2065 family)
MEIIEDSKPGAISMCLSIYLAQVIGLYLFLVSLAMLVHQQRFKKISSDVMASALAITLTGIFMLILGLLIVIDHNIWVADWPVVITIIGWILLLHGLMRLFAPEACSKMCKDMHNRVAYTLSCWIRLGIGIFLIWAGFSQA